MKWYDTVPFQMILAPVPVPLNPTGRVLTDNWDEVRCLRHILSNDEQVDAEGEEDCDSKWHLLSGIRRQVEHQTRQQRHQHTRHNDVHHVVGSFPVHVHLKDHLRVLQTRTASVKYDFPIWDGLCDVPLTVDVIGIHVDGVRAVEKVDLLTTLGTHHEVHAADLLVEGEVGHVQRAGCGKPGQGHPFHITRVVDRNQKLVAQTRLIHLTNTER